MDLDSFRQKMINGKTLVMGILNLTPDSFYDGNMYNSLENAVKHSEMMIECGVDIIDIGGESTRPGSESVGIEEEINRVIPVIEILVKQFNEIRTGKVLLSVDTYKSTIAERALDCGVSIINDISGLRFDPAMVKLASEQNVPVVVMHMKGAPKHMQDNPDYSDVVCEIKSFFQERIDFLTAEGIRKENIILDPGIGFGKTTAHNLEILARLKEFQVLECPLLIGTSRKSFIGRILGTEESPVSPDLRLEGSVVTYLWAILNNVNILRVHDVKETKDTIKLLDAIMSSAEGNMSYEFSRTD